MTQPTELDPAAPVRRNDGPNIRRLIGLILMIVICGFLFAAGIFGFLQKPEMVEQTKQFGLSPHKQLLTSALALVSALLFAIPKTRAIGLIFVAGYLGGAMATHLEHGQNIQTLMPAAFLALLCFATWLRHPHMLWKP